jgi:hypothetical protein
MFKQPAASMSTHRKWTHDVKLSIGRLAIGYSTSLKVMLSRIFSTPHTRPTATALYKNKEEKMNKYEIVRT